MTPAQLQTLRTAIDADPVLAAYPNNGDGNFEIASALDQPSSPSFIVWRTGITRTEIEDDDAFNWTVVDNLSTGSKYRIWEWMFSASGSMNPSKPNRRAGIAACWVGNAQLVAVQAMILAKCKRIATKAEQLLASGTGSDASPGVMTWEGRLLTDDIERARNLP